MNDRKFALMTKDWAVNDAKKLTEQIDAVNREVFVNRADLKPAQETLLDRMEGRRAKISPVTT